MEDILFNQAMLGKLCRVSPNTVSRAINSDKFKDAELLTHEKKKFDVSTARLITKELYANTRRPIRDSINVFYNFKGGTGKTSICYQVASHLSILGFNVLALDLDPQGHLTSIMRVPEDWNGPTIYDVIINGVDVRESIVPIHDGLDLLPANISMTRIEVPLSGKTKREEKLSLVLDPLRKEYDFIMIDTNPTISILNMNALVASDRVNIVCETQPFSLSGLNVLVDEMLSFFSDMGISRKYCIIPNKYEIKTATSQEVLGALRARYGSLVINAVVRKAEEINIAAKRKLPVSAFCKSKSIGFEDVMDLVHEIVNQCL
ncbi:MAG: AAA family ATPase [Alphaproteobacteria bacterium]|nr:AAA family ATPase [Alphaproteobacteria bacterium]